MERASQATTASLMSRELETISEILQAYRALVNIATERITNRASIGQAAHNSMAMQLETQRLINGIEDLLALTRRIRELLIVGPLRVPGKDEQHVDLSIEAEVQTVSDILNTLRSNDRQRLVSEGGGYGQYSVGPLSLPPPVAPVPPTNAPPSQAIGGSS